MFQVIKQDGKRRIGKIQTKHGVITTPFFMPDATKGFVRSLDSNDLQRVAIGPIVVNTFHLYLQPGTETIKKAGGLHKFMQWNNSLLSDSGGYQVFSLIHKNSRMGKITDQEVIFHSPLDGSEHILTPEKSIQIQFDLGVDMMVCLDDPPPNSYSREKISQAVERTINWAKRCKIEYEKQVKKRNLLETEKPLIFGVIQGGKYLDLRKHCAQELVKIGFDGYGLGARHIDSEGNLMEKVVKATAELIPSNALRFALGVGTPQDIIKLHLWGWDMFDCVIPTREGRHGKLFLREKDFFSKEIHSLQTSKITTINIRNKQYQNDFSPVDSYCDCELCQNYSRAYLHYLFKVKEALAWRLASLHNLKFYADLMKKLRNS